METPTSLREPAKYTIAEHPASMVVGTVSIAASSAQSTHILYAAEACVLGSIPPKRRRKSELSVPPNNVLCFEFDTEDQGELSQMYSFILQFGDGPLEPLFSGNMIRSLEQQH